MTHSPGRAGRPRVWPKILIGTVSRAVVGAGQKAAGPEPPIAVLGHASGCGHTLKKYDELLAGNPAWAGPRREPSPIGVADGRISSIGSD